MKPTIDTTRFPIVTIAFGESISFDEIDEHAQELRQVVADFGPVHAIIDVNAISPTKVSAQHRSQLAAMIDDLAARGAILSEATVAKGPLVRGLVTAYTWMRGKKRQPHICLATMEEAEVWTKALLDD